MATAVAHLWTVDEVADYLRLSTRTVHRRVADGTLPALKIGALVRFDPDAVAAAVTGSPLPAREQAVLDELADTLDAREVDR
ncbi:MAG TPA: helix-turn-helix domain-containing protein [Polyangiaceae bacterium]|nr:helix-turn-helix domain-containing protein [Polyangiaceae bacterium]